MRRRLVQFVLSVFSTLLHHVQGRDELRRALPKAGAAPRAPMFDDAVIGELPYKGLGKTNKRYETSKPPPIFVTARFRTGSTLLWRLFRELPGVTAYYEPFNERRWFSSEVANGGVDPSHRGVSDYWLEYQGLSELDDYYDEAWIDKNLFMDAASHDTNMVRFISTLIERTNNTAALQFNRVDFRLEWLRQNFPNGRIVHLYRHPREQWVSSLHGDLSFPVSATLADFAKADKFYLRRWVRDLSWQFPVLDTLIDQHPYASFYALWRLSYVYGRTFSDISVRYEDLVDRPDQEFSKLMAACQLGEMPANFASQRVDGKSSSTADRYADDEWYAAIEYEIETLLRPTLVVRK